MKWAVNVVRLCDVLIAGVGVNLCRYVPDTKNPRTCPDTGNEYSNDFICCRSVFCVGALDLKLTIVRLQLCGYVVAMFYVCYRYDRASIAPV